MSAMLVPMLLSAFSIQGRLIGGSVDQHGCLQSAGYYYCQYTKHCERAPIICEKPHLVVVSTVDNITKLDIPDYGPIG
jgi:hypothetical protein